MKQYRKSDQYYIDQYDRHTIEKLKELAALYHQANEQFNFNPKDRDSKKINLDSMKYKLRFLNTGAERAGDKENTITNWKLSDERKDCLISTNPIPTNIKCNICAELMEFELHSFIDPDEKLIFFFFCINGHLPKKAIYADGSEHYISIRSCGYCGGKFVSKSKKTKYNLTITDTCERCDKVQVSEYDLTLEKILPIDEEERKNYCTDFIGSRTLRQDLEAIISFGEFMEKQNAEIKYNYDHVQQLNIAQMETLLSERIEKSGYIKISFEKPKTGRYLTVEISAQDPTDRDEKNSLKTFKKTIETTLLTTNWRLMSAGITYTLGFISGQLKGYSSEEDIIKIGQEIDGKSK